MTGAFTEEDARYMRLALKLAERGRGAVHPNPMVGAVLVKKEEVVGEGWHARLGGDHAEVAAIAKAGKQARGATLYVTLEPCNHQGKTPPCTTAVIRAGIGRVVIAALDPNPDVKGGGAKELRKHGTSVEAGLLEEEARELNRGWEKYVSTNLPFVTLKVAMTADGRIATRKGLSKWITGPEARRRVHEMRRASDAVLTGIGTVLADDPELTVRDVPLKDARPPMRVVLDSRLRIPMEARILANDPETLVITTSRQDKHKAEALRERGVEVIKVKAVKGRVDLREVLRALGERGVVDLMVEGGAAVNTSFIEQGLADRLCLFVAPRVFGGAEAPAWMGGRGVDRPEGSFDFTWSKPKVVGEDLLLEAWRERG
jgi:diaminohydroxyphosphoribosylaminopyrimidine deaminase/5-amino-6-(5-phosphoribosylamino)uracil reductase